jgi:hypothetical protein
LSRLCPIQRYCFRGLGHCFFQQFTLQLLTGAIWCFLPLSVSLMWHFLYVLDALVVAYQNYMLPRGRNFSGNFNCWDNKNCSVRYSSNSKQINNYVNLYYKVEQKRHVTFIIGSRYNNYEIILLLEINKWMRSMNFANEWWLMRYVWFKIGFCNVYYYSGYYFAFDFFSLLFYTIWKGGLRFVI